MRSPDFEPRFNRQFDEHVEGFFGKVKTKAMKKQRKRDGEEGVAGGGGAGEETGLQLAMKSKNLAGLSADERVERLLQQGLL
jgi:hypothetical protein